jgi:hypothetical protein
MLSRKWKRSGWAIFALVTTTAIFGISIPSRAAPQLGETEPDGHATIAARWETHARKHRTPPLTKVSGSLAIDDKGVEFRSGGGHDQRWGFAEIHTAFIAPHRLSLETYVNRSLRRPGEQRYEFDLTEAVPAPVAAALAAGIARPVQNADPDSNASAIASISVHHRTLTGGTNGVLRFRDGGIDYVTTSRDDSRSWRWEDLQTLSDPDPYHLFLFGYRDTYTFDLKAPLARDLINHATDEIYAHNESVPVYSPGTPSRPDPQGAEMREK